MNPKTAFVGKTNPFTGASTVKPVDRVDPSMLQITNDKLPAHRSRPNKYRALFEQMKPGQSVKCKSEQVGPVSNALLKYVKENKLDCCVRSTLRYDDGLGRVWLIKNERKLKVA